MTFVPRWWLARWLVLSWLPWLALAASNPAQESLLAQEIATHVRVLWADGRPAAGADVIFVGAPNGVFDALRGARFHRITTGKDGRAQFGLAAGADHSVLALGPADAAERWHSGYREGVVAGAILELRLDQPWRERQLEVPDLQPFGPDGFTLELRAGSRHSAVESIPVRSGQQVVLPDWLVGEGLAEIRNARGEWVVGPTPIGDGRLLLDAPHLLEVEVVDAAGKPVAGAEVAALVVGQVGQATPWFAGRPISRLVQGPLTNAEGRSQWLVTKTNFQGVVAWTMDATSAMARSDQLVFDHGVIKGRPPRDAMPADRLPGSAPVRLQLRPGGVLEGQLRQGDQPLANRGLRLDVYLAHKSDPPQQTPMPLVRTVTTDATGRFRIAGVAGPVDSLTLCLEPEDGVPILLRPLAALPTQPLDLDLAQFPLTTIQLTDLGERPPEHVRVVLAPTVDNGKYCQPVVLCGDRGGRVRFRCQPGEWWVFGSDGDGFAFDFCSVLPGASLHRELGLAPLATMRGVMQDDQGRPVAGVGVFPIAWDVESQTNSYPDSLRAASPRAVDHLRHHSAFINRHLVQRAQSGPDGAFTIRFYAVSGRFFSAVAEQSDFVGLFTLLPRDGVVVRNLK